MPKPRPLTAFKRPHPLAWLLPFLGWVGELRQGAVARADVIAGVSVALVLVPQSMAYAQLAGLPVQYGLYAAFLPPIMAALFGSSRQLATGPVAMDSLMTATFVAPLALGDPQQYLALAVLLAAMVGVFQLMLGVLRLGVLVDFVSHPVVVGFTNAAALIIATSQIGKLFGVSVPAASHDYETVWHTIQAAITGLHTPTLWMGLLAFGIMYGLKAVAPRLPAVLAAVVVTTLIAWLTDFAAVGGKVVGDIPLGLPGFALPALDWVSVSTLLPAAMTIGLIGFAEAMSISKAMAARTRQHLHANQELIGQGMANLTAGCFSGYPVAGSFSRSALNLSAGAMTGFSSVVTGLMVGASLLWLTPLLYHLPQATLAAVIIMAVISLFKLAPIRRAWQAERADALVALATFATTLLVAPRLDYGIAFGVGLSLILYLLRTMRPRFAVLSRYPDGTLRDAIVNELPTSPKIAVVRFDGSLYFANAGYFETRLLDVVADNPELEFLVIHAEGLNQIDATGEEVLRHLVQRLRAQGIEVLIARMKRQCIETLRRTGLDAVIGVERIFPRFTYALEYAWRRLGERYDAGRCPLRSPVPV